MYVSSYPNFHPNPFLKNQEQVLLLCYYDPNGISTVPETVGYIQSESSYAVWVINLFDHRMCNKEISLSSRLDISKFSVVIIHNSLSYNVDNLVALDKYLKTPLKNFNGVKMIMKQDENFRYREIAKYIGDTQFDVVFTCLPLSAVQSVYPKEIVGDVQFYRMLTGYVTPTLREVEHSKRPRPIDIGYRGSIQPLSFGRLAYEKRKIGDDIKFLLSNRNYKLDISSNWEDRVTGSLWFDFLGSCRATLGAESGASIFGLNEDIDDVCGEIEKEIGPPIEDESYIESYLGRLEKFENDINYRQISPRHFEAAATKTLQIMYPGEYSGIFCAGKHFISLERDYSNIDEVLEILNDHDKCAEIVECAYQEIILNENYWIESFVRDLDLSISSHLKEKNIDISPVYLSKTKDKKVLLLCAHEPSKDPRLSWIDKGSPDDLKIIQVGLLHANDERSSLKYETANDGYVLADKVVNFKEFMLHEWSMRYLYQDAAGWLGIEQLCNMLNIVNSGRHKWGDYLELMGAPANGDRALAFRKMLKFTLSATARLIETSGRIRGFNAIIATDLLTLPAALILKGYTGVPVLYDAHEYWPESDTLSAEFEQEFWRRTESCLIKGVDYCQTVTPGLAKIMTEQYGKQFDYVPNCEYASNGMHEISKSEDVKDVNDDCNFIFQGNFAPKRGLERLIDLWAQTDSRALLRLRGPDNKYRKNLIRRAEKTGLLDRRIFFLEPVSESKLVLAAREGDVGVIPYEPFGLNHQHCCPNKISQYMAAGLPILANNTSYVSYVLDDSKVGVVVDFTNRDKFLNAITWYINNPVERSNMGKKANQYFHDKFNWSVVSKSLYSELKSMMEMELIEDLVIYEKNIGYGRLGLYRYSIRDGFLLRMQRIRKKLTKKIKRIIKF